MSEVINLELPLEYVTETHNGEEYHMIFCTDESKKLLDIPIIVQADSKEQAIKQAWLLIKFHLEYLERRRKVADRWQPFRKGEWSNIGGTWFTIFGVNVYFRYGKGMKGGRYIPFTNLNISIHSHWKLPSPTTKTME